MTYYHNWDGEFEIDYYYTYEFKNNKKTIQRLYSSDGGLIRTFTFNYEGDRRVETLRDDLQFSKRIYGDDGNLAQVNFSDGRKATYKWENKKSKRNNYDDISLF
jgi:hypothetical protein